MSITVFDPNQIILHIPHNSTYIPEEYRRIFYLDDEPLTGELLRMTDSYTNELFQIPDIPMGNRIIFPYSRLLCDVERFRDDRMEPMAAMGMGVCYRVTSALKPLKSVTDFHTDEMLAWYDRHHDALTDITTRIREESGTALLLDCHSFASNQLPYEAASNGQSSLLRPDICIGTDPGYHTPSWLSDYMENAFKRMGYSVAINKPFAGTMVPMKYYHRERRILSIMLRKLQWEP